MDATLLQKFVPVFLLDGQEDIGPCTFEHYVNGSSLNDTEYAMKIAEPGEWSVAAYVDNSNVCMSFEMAPLRPEQSTSSPVYAVCSTVREGCKAYYSLLYICLFPVGQSFVGDQVCLGQQWCDVTHVRVYVDCQTMKVARVYFPGYGNGGGWVQAEQATYEDTDKKHVQVFVGRGTHSMNPRKGTVWRAGGSQFSDTCKGDGVKWAPVATALPGFLSAWKGGIGKHVPTPQQSPWFSKDDYKTGDELLARTY